MSMVYSKPNVQASKPAIPLQIQTIACVPAVANSALQRHLLDASLFIRKVIKYSKCFVWKQKGKHPSNLKIFHYAITVKLFVDAKLCRQRPPYITYSDKKANKIKVQTGTPMSRPAPFRTTLTTTPLSAGIRKSLR
jgi:hypothetical protein